MGTINYDTSNYITIGLEPFDSDNYLDEDGKIDYDLMSFDGQEVLENIENLLKKYDFYYFHVVVKAGYYEGFYIDIENNFGLCYDSWRDKREALKEATQIGNFLRECVENGLCQVWPGWCTKYRTYAESLAGIKTAIREMKEEVRHIPTWGYCERMGIEL